MTGVQTCALPILILKSAKCSDLRSQLHNGKIDLTLTIETQIIDTNLVVHQLKDEEMVIVKSSEVDTTFLSEDIKKEKVGTNIILSEKVCIAREVVENYLKQQQVRYVNPLELSSVEAIKKCVINGLGISLLPYYIVKEEIQAGILSPVAGVILPQRFSVQLAYHKNKSISLPMEKLVEMISQETNTWK